MSFANIVGVGVRAFNIAKAIGVFFSTVRSGFEVEVVAGVFVGVEIGVVFGTNGSWANLGKVVFSGYVFASRTVASRTGSVCGFVN